MNWRTFIWYVNMVLSSISAITTASVGRYECFAWAALAFASWLIAENLRKPEDTEGE